MKIPILGQVAVDALGTFQLYGHGDARAARAALDASAAAFYGMTLS